MPFDILAARKEASDTEIADYLATKVNFDIKAARESGASDTGIADYLSDKMAVVKPAISTPALNLPIGMRGYAGQDAPQAETKVSLVGGKPQFGATSTAPQSERAAGTRETISNIARPLLEYGGAGAGSAVGLVTGVLGGPPGMVASGVIGGALGYAGGKAAANVLDTALGVKNEELIKRAESASPAMETARQTLNDLKYGAELEMGGQAAGSVISAVVGKVIAPLSRKLITATGQVKREIPKEIQGLVNLYKEAGIKPSPAELVHGGKTLAIIESVLGYSPLSGDVMLKKNMVKLNQLMVRRAELINKKSSDKIVEMVGNDIRKEAKNLISKYATKQSDKVEGLVNEFMGKYGALSKYQTGLKFGEIMSGDRASRAEEVKRLYDEVKGSLPNKGKDFVTLSDDITGTAKKLLVAEQAKVSSQQDKNIIRLLKDFSPEEALIPGFTPEQVAKIPALNALARPPKRITWEGLDETRSTLLEKTRSIIKTQGEITKEARIYSILSNKIDEEMGIYAKSLNTGAGAKILEARTASRTMHELYDKDILRIMNKPPEDVLKRIINNGEVTLLNQIRQATGDAGLGPLRQGFFKQTIESSMQGNTLNPIKLQKIIKSIGDETLNALATKEQINLLKGMADKSLAVNERMAGMKTIQFLETLEGTSNEKVVDAIFKTGNVSNVRLTKRLLSPERIQEITSTILEKKIFKVSGTGSYLPISSAHEFFKHEPELKTLMSPEQFLSTRNFIKLGQRMSNVEALAKNSTQTGQVFVGADALKLLLTSPLKAVKMTGVPWLIAHAYTSPLALNYITSAAKLPSNSPQAINLFIKGWSILYRENQNLTNREGYS
ncbi:MAG: hypothetical protein NUW09_03390, partial [Deltaproteobacteria bacterium]|nr:hypothetical protein [Deltaproteobacteria bacterium]